MDPLIRYLFGFERHVTCHRCPGALHIITWACVPAEFNAWSKCNLCFSGYIGTEYWYLRWKA